LNNRNPKEATIMKLLRLGLSPIVRRWKINLTHERAFELEKRLVLRIGRKDLGTGPLLNLKDGGEGGANPSKRTRKKIGEASAKWQSERSPLKKELSNLRRSKSISLSRKNESEKKKESRRNKLFLAKKISSGTLGICNVPECSEDKKHSTGYCDRHHLQIKQTGHIHERTRYEPNYIILKKRHAEIPFYNRQFEIKFTIMLDLSDVDKVKDEEGLYVKRIRSTGASGERLSSTGMKEGWIRKQILEYPPNTKIKFINGNIFDFRKENLTTKSSRR
jgi:hypothetical protein